MNILEVEFLTTDLKATESFYTENLELDSIEKDETFISFQAGSSKLVFSKTQHINPQYHFAFNIPNNQIENAIQWALSRFKLLEVKEGSCIANFDSWHANSVYFYDNNGNILEFIARFDLDNASNIPFTSKSIESISEIGFATPNPVNLGEQMIKDYSLNYFAKGTKSKQFATLGDDNGLLIIVENGRKWYPTLLEAVTYPTKFTIEVNGVKNEISVNA